MDYRSYLKTPRVFGFHGVYKALAVHTGLVDDRFHLRDLNGQRLVDAWARDAKLRGFGCEHPLCRKWREGVGRSLGCRPPRTNPSWRRADWAELAEAFLPGSARTWERHCLQDLLLTRSEKPLNALVHIWRLLDTEPEDSPVDERSFHLRLEETAPQHAELLRAIRAYEGFSRLLTDAFDGLRRRASASDGRGFDLSGADDDSLFEGTASEVPPAFEATENALVHVGRDLTFASRFDRFSRPLTGVGLAAELCRHHEEVQRQKSREGKRPWFDRIAENRVQMRHSYRVTERTEPSGAYVHYYRTQPVSRFLMDLL